MNTRHAAALALVGWYLMYPPMKPDYQIRTDAPLAEWNNRAGFNTAKDCEAARVQIQRDAKRLLDQAKAARDTIGRDLAEDMAWEQCVASDDPRLKAK